MESSLDIMFHVQLPVSTISQSTYQGLGPQYTNWMGQPIIPVTYVPILQLGVDQIL